MSRVLIQISGPPCSGKSRLARKMRYDGAAVLDEWEFLSARGVASRDQATDADWKAWWRHLDRQIDTQPDGTTLAYISGSPRLRRKRARLVLLNPGRAECRRRAKADRRPPATLRWIDEWYAKHGAYVRRLT